jgi:hypothetical protein
MQSAALQIPDDIVRAMECGELSRDQLRELIRIEAESIGLSFDEAVERARQRTLPNSLIGSDLRFLVLMLGD